MEENKNEQKVNRIEVVRHKWPDEIAKEKKAKRKKIFLVVLMIGLFITGGIAGFVIGNTDDTKETEVIFSDKNDDEGIDKIEEIDEILKNDWYYAEDNDEIINNAIKGMTYSSQDKHTNYLSKEDSKKLVGSLNGDFVGVGIQYQKQNDYFMVTNVFVDSPAWKKGIRKGFILKKVDGISVKGKNKDEVAKMIKGDKGEQVTLTFENLKGKEKEYDVVRDEIDTSVFSEIDKNIGVIKIDTFGDDTAESVDKNLQQFEKEDVTKLIIDLRNNGGGYVDTAVKIASLLLPKDTPVLYEKDKDGELKEFKTIVKDPYEFDKVVVLVNENTASASEILTAALKENLKNCEVVGTKTYGKGTVQRTKEFDDGSMLKYTVAEWLTSKKKSINNVGIKPDKEVYLDPALTLDLDGVDKKGTYKVDEVGYNIKVVQTYLKFMGYKIDRCDGYYSKQTEKAVNKYRKKHHMRENGKIDYHLLEDIQNSAIQYWYTNENKLDKQMNEAKKILK